MIKGTGNRKRKCKNCSTSIRAHEGFIAGVNFVCSDKCGFELGLKALEKQREKRELKAKQSQAKKEREEREELQERKKGVKPLKYWQDKLQALVNQYIVHVRDKGKPCCTCGTTNPQIKYDAGHYRSRGSCPELRYELTNNHKQCSVNCNQYGSGMRAEYREFIKKEYGQEHLDWLDGSHKPLKEQFPHWTDYEKEIVRYRRLLRENGVTPKA